MSPSDIATMSDEQIVELVVEFSATPAVSTFASEEMFAAVCELRKRYVSSHDVPRTPTGRVKTASSVEIDPERWRHAWWRRRITQVALSEMIGKSSVWANVIARKGCVSYFAVDAIASELGEVTDSLVWEIASDLERQRIALA